MRRQKIYNSNKSITYVATFLLYMYLFGMFVTNILHPLYHIHEHTAVVEKVQQTHSCSDDPSFSFNDRGDHSLNESGHACSFCHLGFHFELLPSIYQNETFKDQFVVCFGKYLDPGYNYNFITLNPSRAPPFLYLLS